MPGDYSCIDSIIMVMSPTVVPELSVHREICFCFTLMEVMPNGEFLCLSKLATMIKDEDLLELQ
jgi:hypothetical protein